MYKFASLYGIGEQINRTVIYLDTETEIRRLEQEIKNIFPEFYKRIYFLDTNVRILIVTV